jgi:hypothetical protein
LALSKVNICIDKFGGNVNYEKPIRCNEPEPQFVSANARAVARVAG